MVVEGHSPPARVQSLQPGMGVIHAAVLQPGHRVKSSKLDQRRDERRTFTHWGASAGSDYSFFSACPFISSSTHSQRARYDGGGERSRKERCEGGRRRMMWKMEPRGQDVAPKPLQRGPRVSTNPLPLMALLLALWEGRDPTQPEGSRYMLE